MFVFIQSPIICSSKMKFCKVFTNETLIADGSMVRSFSKMADTSQCAAKLALI